MGYRIPKNTATAAERRIPFVLVDATDLTTPEDITVTGVKISLSFGGGAIANSTNDIVKVSGAQGQYYIELTQAEANNALGPIHGYLKPTGCAATYIEGEIVTDLASIKSKTDNLPSDPADASDIASAFGTVNSTLATIDGRIDTEVAAILAAVDTEVAAIKAKTDNLPAAPAAVGDIPTATAVRDAVFARAFDATKMGGLTFEELVALIASAQLAKLSGAAGTTVTIRNTGDTANAIVATVDADGNRTAVTLTPASVR